MVTSELLLSTKFFIPQPQSNLVVRLRLLKRLETGVQHALTLISAPAGFGKTTLLSNWIQLRAHRQASANLQLQPAWLSLDEDDNDPLRFWLYLITALKRVGMDLEYSVMPLLQIPEPPPIKVILTKLINQFEQAPDSLVLVLDDYHLIHSQAIHDGLAYLLLHLPATFHLVISTRADPLLPLSHLRVQNQLTEIRAADLLFTSSEAHTFLRQTAGILLSPEQFAVLEAHTEGWIAGLQLAALSLRGNPNPTSILTQLTGNQRYILDYFLDEVITRLDRDVQLFLEHTAILDRLCGPLCDWILAGDNFSTSTTAHGSSQAMLEELERNNLFLTPLDSERRWYRYHPLFASCLVCRLEQAHPDRIPQLHSRASQWYENQGMLEEAIPHCLASGDMVGAASFIERCIPKAFEQGYLIKISGWKESLPQEIIHSRPRLCLLFSRTLVESSKYEEAETFLQLVERGLQMETAAEAEAPRWMIDCIRSMLAIAKGDTGATCHYSQAALEGIPQDEVEWRGLMTMNLGFADFLEGSIESAGQKLEQAFKLGIESSSLQIILAAPVYLANVLLMQMRLWHFEETYQHALRVIEGKTGSSNMPIPALSAIYVVLARINEDHNDLSSAEANTLKALELAEQSGSPNAILISALRLASVREGQRRIDEAIQILSEKVSQFSENNDALRLFQAEAGLALVWVRAGKLELAEKWLASLPDENFAGPGYIPELCSLILMRLRSSQGRYPEALQLADQRLAAAQAAGRVSRVFEFQMFRSLFLDALGDDKQATDALYQALVIAQPETILRTLLNEGAPMKRLLERIQREPRIISNPALSDYTARLLDEFKKEPSMGSSSLQKGTAHPTDSANAGLIEPLTDRELEILRLMSRGASNQEIAESLIISLGTVKAHTNHIQGKLGTRNRTETVVMAGRLGLLQ